MACKQIFIFMICLITWQSAAMKQSAEGCVHPEETRRAMNSELPGLHSVLEDWVPVQKEMTEDMLAMIFPDEIAEHHHKRQALLKALAERPQAIEYTLQLVRNYWQRVPVVTASHKEEQIKALQQELARCKAVGEPIAYIEHAVRWCTAYWDQVPEIAYGSVEHCPMQRYQLKAIALQDMYEQQLIRIGARTTNVHRYFGPSTYRFLAP